MIIWKPINGEEKDSKFFISMVTMCGMYMFTCINCSVHVHKHVHACIHTVYRELGSKSDPPHLIPHIPRDINEGTAKTEGTRTCTCIVYL